MDFWISAGSVIDIREALQGHEPVNMWIEGHEDDNECLVFSVRAESRGTGSRHAARQFRNLLLNAAEQSTKRILIDFEGVEIISSSYADELLGRLIRENGFVAFMTRFQLANINETNAFIVDEALKARLKQ